MNETMQLSLLRERFYRRERRSVPAAREFVRGAVADWGFGARLDDVLLCVSELATNALVHGAPPGRGYLVRLLLEEGGAALRVEVHDSGGGQPGVREPDGESGRGLLLVAAVADRWGVGERNPGKIVWCAFGRPGVFGGDLVAGHARLGEG
ncbi:ATP-binding protein [Streptomyces sp. NBC_01221]|uniref:ATP-binding protein n=1 Tax=unclassified Streptomyces TaxID=2593676 RepID=UPI00225B92AB|nr:MULTISPECIES: ATP-binding protein [unclassified Streptomyces]WSP55781.1 ATP-binding protein [Streptomyces sp. NBC_01241]WSU23482.1 ATP-binding protein [Streptomyces sp. NBC_01108]MCX4787491.1 ATP-binding protein [Streptomyces sp. NBC_01221]MCX4796724.1 ATP-binding protein [Streptomyces sp. NBC_01242]WSJ37952.1 ATP-binding protein [Streptomyces sp. NBC_01321]